MEFCLESVFVSEGSRYPGAFETAFENKEAAPSWRNKNGPTRLPGPLLLLNFTKIRENISHKFS